MKQTLALEQALALVENCPDPVILFDAEDRVIAANAALHNLVDAAASRLLGRCVDTLNDSALHLLLTATDTFSFGQRAKQPGYFLAHDLNLPPGTPAKRARILRDVTEIEQLRAEQARLQSELEAQVLHEPRTGLLNRRGLMVALEPQVSRCRRYDSAISLIMMDVYGHSDHDSDFLLRVSQLLKDQLRWADIIACGDQHEFILVLPETQCEDARKLTDKLSEHLQREFTGQANAWAAYGVVEWQKTDNATSLLQRAQTALEQARASAAGRYKQAR